jgi:hypothetical protein
MKITLKDRSLYFKGLLLLIRKDRSIHAEEKRMMMRAGKILGFEKTFCENAIRDVLVNPYIEDVPPRFSNREIADRFIRDGIRFSLLDGTMDERETAWLSAVAGINGLARERMREAVQTVPDPAGDPDGPLEAENLEWE